MPRAAPVIAMVLPWMLSMRPNFTCVKFSVEGVLGRLSPTGDSSTGGDVRPCLRSALGSRIECMFESSDDVRLVAVIEETTRDEAIAGARRMVAIAELVARRVGDDADDPRAWWACDLWDSAAAEVAAAMNISHRKASGQMRIAETLRDHLPAVAALFNQ